jgi:hypothetical protein
MTNIKNPKKPLEYNCKECLFKCSNKKDYSRHILTAKHKILTNPNKKTPKNAKAYMCPCGKSYKHSSSLCSHKKTCVFLKEINNENIENEVIEIQTISNLNNTIELKENDDEKENETDYKEMINELIHANKELQTMLIDQQKQMGELIPKIGNTTNNTNNFNLNVFLNEDCKDALNIMDFVKSLQIQIEDLVTTGKLGFAESTSQLLIKNLNELEITKRPIHCSDLKRETLYIKDNDVWEKESENKDKMKRAVKYLQKESFGVIPDWVKEHPGCARGDNRHNDEYMEIVGNTAGVDNIKDVNKIVKKVAKEVIIDKKK